MANKIPKEILDVLGGKGGVVIPGLGERKKGGMSPIQNFAHQKASSLLNLGLHAAQDPTGTTMFYHPDAFDENHVKQAAVAGKLDSLADGTFKPSKITDSIKNQFKSNKLIGLPKNRSLQGLPSGSAETLAKFGGEAPQAISAPQAVQASGPRGPRIPNPSRMSGLPAVVQKKVLNLGLDASQA